MCGFEWWKRSYRGGENGCWKMYKKEAFLRRRGWKPGTFFFFFFILPLSEIQYSSISGPPPFPFFFSSFPANNRVTKIKFFFLFWETMWGGDKIWWLDVLLYCHKYAVFENLHFRHFPCAFIRASIFFFVFISGFLAVNATAFRLTYIFSLLPPPVVTAGLQSAQKNSPATEGSAGKISLHKAPYQPTVPYTVS